MICLYNGNYEEHDIGEFYAARNGGEKCIARMEREYAKYPGTVIGDFTVVKVEYDWGRRDQRWTVKCNKCGTEIYKYHAKDWKRGNGSSLKCKHCTELEKQKQKEFAKYKAEKSEKLKKERIGNVYGDWKVIEYDGKTSKCRIECTQCGHSKYAKIDDVIAQFVNPCSHKKPIDYTGDEWIGKRNGHLTVIGRSGKDFVAKCDCGNEIVVKPTFMFTYKNRRDCGMPDCPYSTPLERASRERRKRGFDFERQIEQELVSNGYNATKTQDQADFGVDVIIQDSDGNKIAVQCKKQDTPAGVGAIQEVYAGGRFYDCDKFAVICYKGFSNPAILMARKLGVYLCDGEFEMPSDIEEYTTSLLPIYHENNGCKKLYEINGEKKTKSDWCAIYGKPEYRVDELLKKNCTLKTALEIAEPFRKKEEYTIHGVTGSLAEVCKFFEMVPETVKYRMKQKGMTLEEAIFTPKLTQGRPSTI